MATIYVYHSLLSRRVSLGTWIRVQLFVLIINKMFICASRIGIQIPQFRQ